MRRFLPLLIAGLALASGCSDRQRLNPLDPGNPSTGGRPTGFVALAGDGFVTLQWDPAGRSDIAGYLVSRRETPDSAFKTLGSLPSRQLVTLVDTGLPNGVLVAYRLQYRFTDGRLSQAAEDFATPGSLRIWVTDYAGRSLLRVTPDARHVADRSLVLFQGPTDVDVNPANGLVWACDPNSGRVVIHNPGSLSPQVISNLTEPSAVAIDPADGHAWICDSGSGALFRFASFLPDDPDVSIGGLAEPISVAVDPIDGSAWVCERSGDRVLHYTREGSSLGSVPVRQPSRVAVDSLTRSVWVTSFAQRRLSRIFNGALVDSVDGFAGPIGIAIDPRRGHIWVADSFAGSLSVFDRFGDRVFAVGGLPEVREIGIDRATGEAWVTLPGSGQVVRLSADGAILGRVVGLAQPIDIAVQGF